MENGRYSFARAGTIYASPTLTTKLFGCKDSRRCTPCMTTRVSDCLTGAEHVDHTHGATCHPNWSARATDQS